MHRAVELDPNNAEAHYGLFCPLFSRPRVSRKRRRLELEDAIQADPNYYQAVAELGLWNLNQGHLAKAADLFGQSLKIHPRDAVVLNNLGIVRFFSKTIEPMPPRFRESLSIDPNYVCGIIICEKSNNGSEPVNGRHSPLLRSRRHGHGSVPRVPKTDGPAAQEPYFRESFRSARYGVRSIRWSSRFSVRAH